MKAPTNYGSDNEETRFIRRVAAPDRPNSKRRQKKRLAVAGAALGLLAASAGIGYATLRTANTTSAMETMQLEADRAFVSKLGDAFHPSFETVDQNNDGIAAKEEILADLQRTESADVEKVKSSNLSGDIQENVLKLLEEKLKSDVDCARQASDQRQFPVTSKDAQMFYYLLDVFCPKVTIAVTPPEGDGESGLYNHFTENNAEQATAASTETEQTQVVDVVSPSGEEQQVIIEGEPEHGEQKVEIPNGEGSYTETQVHVTETSTGEEKLAIPDGEGGTTTVTMPETPPEMPGTETEQTQVVDVVSPSGEEQQVIIEGEPEHGEQKVEIPNGEGSYTETQVHVTETSTGEEKLAIPDGEGGTTTVTMPETPPEMPGTETEQTQVVDVVSPSGEEQQVIIEGEPEHGEQKVEIPNGEGSYTETQVHVTETSTGEEKLAIPDGEGGTTAVTVPEEIPNGSFMTKDEFREWIKKHYADKFVGMAKQSETLAEEMKVDQNRVVGLQDCVYQAANKFGWYGVYERAPYFQDAVDWVENVCMASNASGYRMLRG
ncbi:hypothetical protein BBJ29_007171 [Phytophthora kernoviae]|uniref:Uncharacterized protein n=1 Tax=Phytophthora kernoviae TaxID=325452 RepID=A0A421FQ83_9STRA|nr:hypothetical protein BBJ29_007171 [Phytophthora kernoviae]